jgi:hypothetical protein
MAYFSCGVVCCCWRGIYAPCLLHSPGCERASSRTPEREREKFSCLSFSALFFRFQYGVAPDNDCLSIRTERHDRVYGMNIFLPFTAAAAARKFFLPPSSSVFSRPLSLTLARSLSLSRISAAAAASEPTLEKCFSFYPSSQ